MASTTTIELNQERQQELREEEQVTSHAPQAAPAPSPASSSNRQTEAIEERETQEEQPKKSGTLQVEDFYRFDRFNMQGEYKNVKRWHDFRSEFVFEHKEDHTKINVRKHKITFDNTDRNYAAALDLAQDKGWKSIHIKGRDAEAKAEIWYLAQLRGLETTGYEPTRADRQRLAGALERQKQEGLDIRPQADAAKNQEGKVAEPQVQGKTAEKAEERAAEKTADMPAQEASTATAKKTRGRPKKTAEAEPTQAQIVESAMKEVVIEAGRVLDLDDKQITVLENILTKGIAQATADGKAVDVKTLADKVKTVKSKLPTIRTDITKAAQMEQSMVKDRQQAAAQQQPSRQPTPHRQPQQEIGGR